MKFLSYVAYVLNTQDTVHADALGATVVEQVKPPAIHETVSVVDVQMGGTNSSALSTTPPAEEAVSHLHAYIVKYPVQ